MVGLGFTALAGQSTAAEFDIPAASPARVLPASYFGTHIHRLTAERPNGPPATKWPGSAIGALRLWDSGVQWADIEPRPGKFDFVRLDTYVSTAKAQQATVLLVLGGTPQWASARPDEPSPYGPGNRAEPAHWTDWDRYVQTVARRYRGLIARYELWNEPYFSDFAEDRGKTSAFFTGSVATMVELARRTNTILRAEDPEALLLSPGFVGSPHRMNLFLSAGGGAQVAGIAYHFYEVNDAAFIQMVQSVRLVLKHYGLSHLPLINSECGFGSDQATWLSGGADRKQSANLLAGCMILGAYQGLEAIYQYAWDNDRTGMVNTRTGDSTPNLNAFVRVQDWLTNSRLLGCRSGPDKAVICEAERDGRRLTIAWHSDHRSLGLRIPLPAGSRVLSTQSIDADDDDTLPANQSPLMTSSPRAVWWQGPDRS